MSFETACFSMYSDMSKRTSAFWWSKRNSARRRATSVFPTPEGPRKMKEPIGRFGFLTPRRERRIARLIAPIARSWPITRFLSVSSMWRSFSASSIWRDVTGMPVQLEMISSTSARVTSTAVASSLRGRLRPLDLLLDLDLALAQEDGALEVLLGDRLLHLLDDLLDLVLEAPEVLGVRGLAELHLRAGLVEDVDRLVGEEAVGDVAVRLVDGRLDRLARVAHAVELLVPLADALEDLEGLLLVGRGDRDRLEAPEERAVLLDVLPVLLERRRADARDLAAREGGLQDVRGVERALRRAGADQGVDLVDEDDEVLVLLELLEDSLEALLELAAVLRARDDEREVEGQDLPLREEERDAALDDPLREPLDDRRLADAGLAEEDRVVLRPPREDLDDPLDLVVAADERVECALLGERRQVARVLGEERELLLLLGGLALLDEGDRLLADAVEVEAVSHEDAARDAGVDAEDADQEVLRADVGMHHRLGLVRGVGEDLLRLLRERQLLRRGDALDEDAVALDLPPDVVRLDVEAGEDLLDDVLALAKDAEEDVLGLDDLRAELRRLVAGEEQGPAGFLVVLLEHRLTAVSCPQPGGVALKRRRSSPLLPTISS